jgi:hypothetical protein
MSRRSDIFSLNFEALKVYEKYELFEEKIYIILYLNSLITLIISLITHQNPFFSIKCSGKLKIFMIYNFFQKATKIIF